MTFRDGPPDPRQELGRLGESAAEAFLVRRGLVILARRYRRRSGEIDLIAEEGQTLVFIEVKTRSPAPDSASPAESVTSALNGGAWRVSPGRYLAEEDWTGTALPLRRGRCDRRSDEGRVERDPVMFEDAFRLWPGG